MNTNMMEPFVELRTMPGQWDLSILGRNANSASTSGANTGTVDTGSALRREDKQAEQDMSCCGSSWADRQQFGAYFDHAAGTDPRDCPHY